jgi:dolichol-phosphate mannosyltransferase
VVVPSFNEAGNLVSLLEEWIAPLRQLTSNVEFWIYDDGSTDHTPALLEELSQEYPQLRYRRTVNQGHGQTCLQAYREHCSRSEVDFIFQIDSDGQCDPQFFSDFWPNRTACQTQFGERVARGDGRLRQIISMLLRWMVFLATGKLVRDPNVPYRLMPRELLGQALAVGQQLLPFTYWPLLSNVYLCLLLEQVKPIQWRPIFFRARLSGNPSVKGWRYAQLGIKTFLQLRPLSHR